MNTWHLTSKLTKTMAALGLATAALVAQPAMAEVGRTAVQVNYADLNLTTPEGQDQLQSRLDKAAIQVCRYDAKGRLNTSRTEIACHREARQKVSVQMASIADDNRLGG